MSNLILPPHVQKALNEASKSTPRTGTKKKIFVGLPNMCTMSAGLVAILFRWAIQRDYIPWFHILSEKRHHDHARNMLVESFLNGDCDYMLMIDEDVDPNPKLLTLCDQEKDIIAGNVFCWINGELMPSIWQQAECEQCRVTGKFFHNGELHDPREYRIIEGTLERWNPFRQTFEPFATREGGMFPELKCRCRGSGMDPFVYRTHQGVIGNAKLLQVASVGSAAMMISRRVFEKMQPPYFQFLYRPDRSILLTEDHFFCWKARESGLEIWADAQMWCTHYKKIDLFQVNQLMQKVFMKGMEYQKSLQNAKDAVEIPESVEASQ